MNEKLMYPCFMLLYSHCCMCFFYHQYSHMLFQIQILPGRWVDMLKSFFLQVNKYSFNNASVWNAPFVVFVFPAEFESNLLSKISAVLDFLCIQTQPKEKKFENMTINTSERYLRAKIFWQSTNATLSVNILFTIYQQQTFPQLQI